MIRLVACDLDGTLLYPDGRLPAGIFPMIRRLREKGIRFAAASGRQYDNLRRLFAPEDVDFLCENGAVIAAGGKRSAAPIPRDMAEEIIRDIEGAGMHLLLSTPAFTVMRLGAPRAYTDDIFYRLQNACVLAPDPAVYAGECVKLAGFSDAGVEPLAPALQEKWGGQLHCDIAGRKWLDFTCTNKGAGIRALAEAVGVSLRDTAAFGDQFNDESMLDLVGHPYIMAHAPAPLLQKGYTPCGRVMDALEDILREA